MPYRYFPWGKLVVALVALSGWVANRWFNPRRRAKRLLRRMRAQGIAALQDGQRAHVRGVAAALERTLISPIDQRVCLGYRAIIEVAADARRSFQEGGPGVVVWSETMCVPFLISDGETEAVVEGPFDLEVDVDDKGEVWANLPPTVFRLLENPPFPVDGKEVRFTEAWLVPGDSIEVVGRVAVNPDPQGQREALRSTPMRRMLRGSSQQPVVITDAEESDAV
jgi:hypothetical protein